MLSDTKEFLKDQSLEKIIFLEKNKQKEEKNLCEISQRSLF